MKNRGKSNRLTGRTHSNLLYSNLPDKFSAL
jgi:hypothetical protein